MPVRLAGAGVLARVEEGEEALLIPAVMAELGVGAGLVICRDTGLGSFEVRSLEDVGLIFPVPRGKNEMLGDYRELVEDKYVRGAQ